MGSDRARRQPPHSINITVPTLLRIFLVPSDVSLSAGVDPVILSVPGEGGQPPRAYTGSVEDVQRYRGGGQAGLEPEGGEAGAGRVVARLQAAGHGLAGLFDGERTSRVLLLVMEKVAPRTVCAVTGYPVLESLD